MKSKEKRNLSSQDLPLDVSINTENLSNSNIQTIKQLKQYQSYSDYIQKLDRNIQYEKSSSTQIESSLSQMRVVLKQFNLLLNKMMDKNYQYLAQRHSNQVTTERQMQLLRAQIQGAKKLISNQDIQITTLNNMTYAMEGKEQSYEQKLIDQIIAVKDKMPSVNLQSKHSACDINRNGYVLVNQQQDNSLYFKVNILRSDIQRAYQRLRRLEEKQKSITEKQRQLQEKNYQIGEKFSKCIETARQNCMQITMNGSIISLKQKYTNLQKKRDQEFKKNALLQHVSRNNQSNIQKKITDMKKLIAQFNFKHKQLSKKLQDVETQIQKSLKNANIGSKIPQKSFIFRYAETLLKGERLLDKQKSNSKPQKDDENQQYEDDFQDFLNNKSTMKKSVDKNENLSALKPSLNLLKNKKQSNNEKYEKSMSLVQLPSRKVKQQKNGFFQDKQTPNKNKVFNIRRMSANQVNKQLIKQTNNSVIKSPESPKLKLWKQSEEQRNQTFEKQYKISKPKMNLKKKAHNLTSAQKKEDSIIQRQKINSSNEQQNAIILPKYSRLTQKKGSRITDQYMDYLEQKGRKILGLP